MDFAKLHGLGNDYVFVNAIKNKVADPAALALKVCDRRFGIGSDGLILVLPSKRDDFRMRMFNPDGSEAEMCGNGIRCFGKYVYDHGLTKKRVITVETIPGVKGLDMAVKNGKVDQVAVDMGPALNVPKSFYVGADGSKQIVPAKIMAADRVFEGAVLSVGNPHFVVFVDDVDGFPIEKYGPACERHPDFPSRINTEFVKWIGERHLQQRTWERGANETFACGTGATAVAASLFLTGKAKGTLTIDLRGGRLLLEQRGDHFVMTGPAVEVCTGTLNKEWLGSGKTKAKAKVAV
jgi:diaminopimelate epimerase